MKNHAKTPMILRVDFSKHAFFNSLLGELETKQVEIKPIHELWISFWYRGKRFMYAAPKRNFFVVDVLKIDGNWSGRIRISTRKDWEQTFDKLVAKYLQYLDAAK